MHDLINSRTLATAKDVIARIGGEELACPRAAMQVAEQIRQTFAGLSLLEPGLLSVSIGVMASSTAGHELPHLLSQADMALQGAKHRGRNQEGVSPGALPAQFG
ncbi:MAG: diguanylate cyclase [Pseudomonas piscis]|uniref:diguanylate cyclase n=1 Tax=Pseudomonas piscis TaxID=2614538 RepID=UPI003D2AF569